MADFVLKVQDITEAGKDYVFAITYDWLKGGFAGSDLRARATEGPGRLELRAQKSGADILVRGQARASIVTDCSRCLEDALIMAKAELAILFTARGADHRPPADEDELTPEDLQKEFFAGERVELDEVVREHLILEVPMQPLCSEDCKGIRVPDHVKAPIDFGAREQGVDPRLAPLKQIKVAQNKE